VLLRLHVCVCGGGGGGEMEGGREEEVGYLELL
jgi:hypothetical protein